jgi:hypothetical protein
MIRKVGALDLLVLARLMHHYRPLEPLTEHGVGPAPRPGGACTGCIADSDGDGAITADDIFAFLADWFEQLSTPGTRANPPHYRSADVDGSGAVDADDIFAFLNLWFASCP